MRCYIAAFAAMGGACIEVIYDLMKTAVIGEDSAGVVGRQTREVGNFALEQDRLRLNRGFPSLV